jgi:hypothetical protein
MHAVVANGAYAKKPDREAQIADEEEECGCHLPGRFTGGGFQIVDGVRITRGLTLHCDRLLSNNLEINWQGNQFHMEEHLHTALCFDDPDITQAPPRARIDTIQGQGIGRFNTVDGYRVKFKLIDAGEPGTEDRMGIKIWEEGNEDEPVLEIWPPVPLTRGNLQAHDDQPHRSR